LSDDGRQEGFRALSQLHFDSADAAHEIREFHGNLLTVARGEPIPLDEKLDRQIDEPVRDGRELTWRKDKSAFEGRRNDRQQIRSR
jgi:hypothetical protein